MFTAELIAIERAMLFLSDHHCNSFIIYTDSKGSIDAINSDTHHPFISSILKLFKKLTRRGNNILFCWVLGHMDIPSHEKADMVSKCVLNPLYHLTPFKDVKHVFKRFIYNKWLKH